MWSVALGNLVSNKADPKELLLELCYQCENDVAVLKFASYVSYVVTISGRPWH